MLISSSEELAAFGATLGRSLIPPTILSLSGDLGAGKTTLAKGLISSLTGVAAQDITSPTFQYMHVYEKVGLTVVHFDLWRLKGPEEFLDLGLEEYLQQDIVLIEWPDRIASLLPPKTIDVSLSVVDGGRFVTVTR